MALQDFNDAHEIALDLTASEVIPDYAVVMIDPADSTKVKVCTAGSTPLAVSVPCEDEMMPDGNGGFIKRTGWQISETPTLIDSGTVWVKLSGNSAFQDIVVPAASGAVATEAAPTLTTPTSAEVAAAFANLKLRLGKIYKAGKAGDIVPLKLRL